MGKKWSKNFDSCITCSRNNINHYARGYCSTCWYKINKKKRIRKYDALSVKIRGATKIHKISKQKRIILFSEEKCFYCEKKINPLTGRDFQIDHKIVGIKDESNLVACCFKCNRRKSDNTIETLILFLTKITQKKVILS